MQDYVIVTDSSCDLPEDIIEKFGIRILNLDVIIEGEGEFPNDQVEIKEFYSKLREGANIKTSAVNMAQATELLEEILSEGKDVLYLGFSSALSSTYQTVTSAARELSEKYSDRRIYDVDTLAASMGQGLLVYKAAKAKEAGKSLEDNAAMIESMKLNLDHWFTVDDLFFLKRGGRVSGVTATLGTILSIKPVLHVDDEGRLINVGKERGRKASINQLMKKMEELGSDLSEQDIFISHGDCIEDAEKLANMIKTKYSPKSVVINYVGPVIGAHSGPGTLALFFVGEHR
jgi:DegV family protein with EDD domain